MAGIKGCVISDRNYIFEGEIGLKKRKLKGKQMHIGMIAPISWRVPPRGYGPWERVVSLLTEGLVERGIDVTLFATEDSLT